MDKISYALGMSVAQNIMKIGVKSFTIDDFSAAVRDMLAGDVKMSADDANKALQEMGEQIRKEEEMKVAQNRKEGEEFLKTNKTKDGVMTTKSGLQYKVITEGTGRQPGSHNRVKCHYEGRFISGEKFDSSYDRKTPAEFGLQQVIPGWTEGLQLMKEGAKYEFYIPYELGYGPAGMPGAIPGCTALIFAVELLQVL